MTSRGEPSFSIPQTETALVSGLTVDRESTSLPAGLDFAVSLVLI